MWLTESDLLILEYNVDAIVKCCVGAFASAIALIFLILVIDTHVHSNNFVANVAPPAAR